MVQVGESQMSKKVLLTGSTGFLGQAVSKKLQQSGFEIIDFSPSAKTGFKASLLDEAAVKEACKNADLAVHLAAFKKEPKTAEEMRQSALVNILGTSNLLKHCEGRLVFASTSAVYPSIERPASEKTLPAPRSLYGASKLCAEQFVRAFAKARGFDFTILRLFNAYGQGDCQVTQKLVDCALSGKEFALHRGGSQIRDFVFVDDVAEAFSKALQSKNASGEVFNVGTGVAHSLNDLISLVENLSGKKIKVSRLQARSCKADFSLADIGKVESLLGWRAKTSLEEGLRKMIEASIA